MIIPALPAQKTTVFISTFNEASNDDKKCFLKVQGAF